MAPSRLLPASAGWTSDPGWAELLVELEVAGLEEGDAATLLASIGVPESERGGVITTAQGVPLLLLLAARSSAALPVTENLVPSLVEKLPRPRRARRALPRRARSARRRGAARECTVNVEAGQAYSCKDGVGDALSKYVREAIYGVATRRR